MRPFFSLCLLSCLAAGPALAQETGAHSQGDQQSGSVQVGAGTKGDVTPGASGPQDDDGGDGLEPLPATFEIRSPADPFYGPGMLPVGPPRQLRCEIIQDAAARSRCESRAASPNGGQNDG